METPEEQLHRLIETTTDDCWRWTGYINPRGYGQFIMNQRRYTCHRFAYELHVGPIEKGLHVHHRCGNTTCCNPAHLELLSPREHLLRGNAHYRANVEATHCHKGHEYTAENTQYNPGRPDSRVCRECTRIRGSEYRKRKAAGVITVPKVRLPRSLRLLVAQMDREWARFEVNIVPSDTGCWEWIGASHHGGYGVMMVNRKQIYAYRYAYEMFTGRIPAGMHVHHRCENPRCCNPSHLEAMSPHHHPDSHRPTHCVHGHPFSPDNTRWNADGSRTCIACSRRRTQAYRTKTKPSVCVRGHEFTPENTRIALWNGTQRRVCIKCIECGFRKRPAEKIRTHCSHGHELIPANLYVNKKTGVRQCILCRREIDRRRRGPGMPR